MSFLSQTNTFRLMLEYVARSSEDLSNECVDELLRIEKSIQGILSKHPKTKACNSAIYSATFITGNTANNQNT